MAYSFEKQQVRTGEKEWIDIPVTTDADMREITIPACVVHGGDGPVVWMQGCVHGPEHVGAVGVRNFVTELDPDDVSGTVIGIPVVNRLAFANKQRTAPIDHMDLNRNFPGSQDGSFTEQLADAVLQRAKEHADYFVDLHTGGNEFLIPGYSIYPVTGDEVESRSIDLCEAADLPYAVGLSRSDLGGAMFSEMADHGVPSTILETGGEGRLHEEHVANAIRGLENICTEVDVLQGAVETENTVSIHQSMAIPQAHAGGLFEAEVEGNTTVSEGQRLATITDLTGETKEVIESPYDGVVVAVRTYAIARPGDWLFELTPE